MTPQTNTELLEETLENIDNLLEYILSESGDPNLPLWLEEIRGQVSVVYDRLKDSEGD
jgi:hypothetical protein